MLWLGKDSYVSGVVRCCRMSFEHEGLSSTQRPSELILYFGFSPVDDVLIYHNLGGEYNYLELNYFQSLVT